MSELKAFRIIQGDTGGYGAPSYKCDTDGNRLEEWNDICEVYEKSEADKVIAYLQKQLKLARTSLVKLLAKTQHEARYSKYKRCMAMADKCVDLCNKARDLCRWAEEENLAHHYSRKVVFFARWHNRWMELAEQFKPNNSTAQ